MCATFAVTLTDTLSATSAATISDTRSDTFTVTDTDTFTYTLGQNLLLRICHTYKMYKGKDEAEFEGMGN